MLKTTPWFFARGLFFFDITFSKIGALFFKVALTAATV